MVAHLPRDAGGHGRTGLHLRGEREFGHVCGAGAAAPCGPTFLRTLLPDAPARHRWLGNAAYIVDLGENIGSLTWFRGLATLGAMVTALVHVSPGPATPPIAALAMAVPTQMDSPRYPDNAPAVRVASRPQVESRIEMPEPPARNSVATPLRLTGLVGTSLYHALRDAGVPPPIIADYLHAIARQIDISDIRTDDRFDLVLEQRHGPSEAGEAERLLYAGLLHGGRIVRLLRWTWHGDAQWFDANGVSAQGDGFAMPVAGARLTSGFGMRFHPILGFSRMHQGVDLAAPYGSPIVAASDGVVRFAGWHGEHGNFVRIDHAGGLGTGYGHMSSFVVAPGMRVQRGQLIGYVGMSGLTTGPHLHFEVTRDGIAIDPAAADFATTTQITGQALGRFHMTLARLTGLAVNAGVKLAADQGPAKG